MSADTKTPNPDRCIQLFQKNQWEIDFDFCSKRTKVSLFKFGCLIFECLKANDCFSSQLSKKCVFWKMLERIACDKSWAVDYVNKYSFSDDVT